MNCVTRSNSRFCVWQIGRAADLKLQRRVALPPLCDPVLHQVDPVSTRQAP